MKCANNWLKFFQDFDVSLSLNFLHNVMEKAKGSNPVTKRTDAGVFQYGADAFKYGKMKSKKK